MVIGTVKPVAVGVVTPNVGFLAVPTTDVAATGAEPSTYPVLVVVIVAVELVATATPVTVTKPLPLIATEPDAVAIPAHVLAAS